MFWNNVTNMPTIGTSDSSLISNLVWGYLVSLHHSSPIPETTHADLCFRKKDKVQSKHD